MLIKPPPKNETLPITIPEPEYAQHNPNDEPPPEVLPSPISEPSIIERQLNGCLVRFQDGAIVESVETAFESRCVVIYGLTPYAISDIAILDALQGLPEVKQISLAPEHGEARLTFLTAAEAAQVVRSGAERLVSFGEEVVLAFDTKSIERTSGSLRSTKVKISWFGPSRIAWAHYPTVSRARQEAVRLGGYPFEGKKLSVQFQQPSRHQRSSFSIEIKGLPLSVKKNQVQSLTGSNSVTLGEASYNLTLSHTAVRQLLEKHGDLESFEVLSKDPSKSKITAFAQFTDPAAAETAVKSLHQQQQAFLRHGPLLVEHIHAIKYNISARQFSVLKPDIDALRATYDPKVKLKHYERDESGQWLNIVCLRAYGSDPKLLAQVKAALEGLLEGKRIVSDAGVGIWDEYFAREEGQQYLEALCSDLKVFIKLDLRLRKLSMFGAEVQQNRIREELIQKVISLQMERRAISLSNEELRALVTGGMTSLHEELGMENLNLDIAQRTLVVQGTNEDATAAREHLKFLTAAAADQTHLGGGEGGSPAGESCPICFCDVSRPEKLPCGHTYCSDCLRHFLHAASRAPVPSCVCVASGCTQVIPYRQTIQRLLGPDDETRLLRAAFLAHVHARPDEFVYCPTPDCTTLYRPTRGVRIRCPVCLVQICASCKVADHEGLRCLEYEEQLSGHALANARWKEEHGIKPCPKCGADLEKNGGCNHITVSLFTLLSPSLVSPRLASSRLVVRPSPCDCCTWTDSYPFRTPLSPLSRCNCTANRAIYGSCSAFVARRICAGSACRHSRRLLPFTRT